jgi:hypothetical protein
VEWQKLDADFSYSDNQVLERLRILVSRLKRCLNLGLLCHGTTFGGPSEKGICITQLAIA